jgi:hopanoid biosynthesis associated RND transporter like protein HpnN
MLKAKLALVTRACTRHAWLVIALSTLVAVLCGVYVARHFAIDTDINKLLSPNLPWVQREHAFSQAFPQRHGNIFVVVDAPTAELATQASAALARKLAANKTLFTEVEEPGATPLFTRNGLLFLPPETVARVTDGLTQAKPLVQVLVTDPSLRGLVQIVSFGLMGVDADRLTLDDMTSPLTTSAATLETVLAGKPSSFSWQGLLRGEPPQPMDLRRFIEVRPVLDFGALEPGRKATDAIRQAAADLGLAAHYQARVRLTGTVPIQDEEFGTLKEGAGANAVGTLAVVLIILYLALRSPKIILAVVATTLVGLVVTAALGLWMTGALNPISVAFAVLFVGIGIDFSIQYSVRYRAERYEDADLGVALKNTAINVGVPLTLAAATTAAGFFSFLPTSYGGFSELGAIAGVGMMVAWAASIVLLPALLAVLNPPAEKEELGYRALAPVDRFCERHRIKIVVVSLALVGLGAPLLYFLQFDFNPMNLRSPKAESIATYLDLRRDPMTGASAIDAIAPSLDAARAMAHRIEQRPEVARVMTLDTFIPADQDEKLAHIRKAAAALGPTLALPAKAPPSDADDVAALTRGAAALDSAAQEKHGPGADAARRLAAAMRRLAAAGPDTRAAAAGVFLAPLATALAGLRELLQAQPVTEQSIPPAFAAEWVRPDGRARLQIYPRGDPNDNAVLRQFATAVLAVEPGASGGPIAILEAGRTMVTAFMQAAATAVISIAIMLWLTLRRARDVVITLVPLLLASVLTLEICVAIGLQLNFANIIALPLLLGIGVAFEIYYVMAWRAGQRGLLQSSLTRAVVFSAMTTATAFGSLWLSSHPGTSSMGKLLALTLACTLASAVLFQPVLMGPPRQEAHKDG